MKRYALLSTLFLPLTLAVAEEGCFDKVDIGDPVRYVVERCGEPVRRERDIYVPTRSVEIIRGTHTLKSNPVLPQRMEKWYYDTTLDRATVIEIKDGGVLDKRRLKRDPVSVTPVE